MRAASARQRSLLPLPLLVVLVLVLLLAGGLGATMTTDQEYEKYLREIPPECISPGISPREALPDKNVFVAVKRAMLVANFSKNYTFNMNAGLGTTGTHGLNDMCANAFSKQVRAIIHYKWFNMLGLKHMSNRMQKAIQDVNNFVGSYRRLVNRHRDIKRTDNQKDTRLTNATESEHLAHDLEMTLTSLFTTLKEEKAQFGCLSDSPWVYFVAEFFFAACPNVKLMLSVRDYLDWGESRREHHMQSSTPCICPEEKGVRDPFSITQCMRSPPTANNSVDCKSIKGSTVSELSRGLQQHNQFVHSIVPPRFLLELNLFMSKYDDSIGYDEWTHVIEQVVQRFLLPGSVS